MITAAPLFIRAQAKKQKPYKPPVLVSSVSSFSGKKLATTTEAKNALTMPLVIKDSAGKIYAISSYQFLYRRRAQAEDEVTGEVRPVFSVTSQLFKTSPLPALWINRVSEDLKSGEELYFFDIIAKDDMGRVMYAPDISITVK